MHGFHVTWPYVYFLVDSVYSALIYEQAIVLLSCSSNLNAHSAQRLDSMETESMIKVILSYPQFSNGTDFLEEVTNYALKNIVFCWTVVLYMLLDLGQKSLLLKSDHIICAKSHN